MQQKLVRHVKAVHLSRVIYIYLNQITLYQLGLIT